MNEVAQPLNVTVQALLDIAGLNDGQLGSFTVLDFACPGAHP